MICSQESSQHSSLSSKQKKRPSSLWHPVDHAYLVYISCLLVELEVVCKDVCNQLDYSDRVASRGQLTFDIRLDVVGHYANVRLRDRVRVESFSTRKDRVET